MHIVELNGNLSSPNGQPWSFPLSQKTLLLGSNGAGKTRILHGLNLVLRAATDDLFGKNNVKSPQSLFQLAPFAGAGDLYAHARFDEDTECAWGSERLEDGTIKTPRHEPPVNVNLDTCFPLANVRAALSGDENAKNTFLGWLAQGIQTDDVMACVPVDNQAVFRDIYEKQKGNVVERLTATLEYVQSRGAILEKDAAAQDALATNVIAGLGARPEAHLFEEAKNALAGWNTALVSARAFESYTPVSDDVTTRLTAARTAGGEAAAALAQWQAEGARRETLAPVLAAPQAAPPVAHLAAALEGHGDACPVCQSPVGHTHLEAWKAHYERAIATYKQEVLTERAAYDVAQRAHAAALQEGRQAVAYWQQQQQSAALEVNRLSALLAGQQPTPPNPGVTAQQAQLEISRIQSLLAQMNRAEGAWGAATAAQAMAKAFREQRPVYTGLASVCKAAVRSLLDTHSVAFIQKVQGYLPEDWAFYLDASDTFAIGYKKGGVLRTALSGAERDAMLVAIAMVVAEMGGGSGKVKKSRIKAKAADEPYMLVIPEDRDRDVVTLGKLMRAWAKFPGQVVMASTKLPKGPLPKGWTVIDVDAWSAGLGVGGAEGGEGSGASAEAGEEDGIGGGNLPTATEAPAPPAAPPAPAAPKLLVPPADPAAEAWYWHNGTETYLTLRADEAVEMGEDTVYLGDMAAKIKHEQSRSDRADLPRSEEDDALLSRGFSPETIALLPRGSTRRRYLVDSGVASTQVRVAVEGIEVLDARGTLLFSLVD